MSQMSVRKLSMEHISSIFLPMCGFHNVCKRALCGSSSCLGGLRSLLNIEGILTLPMFLLSDGYLI